MNDISRIWTSYCGTAPAPGEWLARWNLDPVLLAVLAVALVVGRGRAPATRSSQWAAAAVMIALFVSPLCALGTALFAARAVHHLALVLLLAPLIATIAAAPLADRRLPLMPLTVLQAVIFWLWHLPALYDAALSNSAAFWAMQASITLSAAAWWAALKRAALPVATAGVLAAMVQMGVLGALLVFAGHAFYPPHIVPALAWGVLPIEDQQIAGLIMWVAGGGAYLALAMALAYRALAPATRPHTA